MNRHAKTCNAPICRDMPTKGILWYIGEKVCTQTPYTKWQKKQLLLNESKRKYGVRKLNRAVDVHSMKTLSV